MTSHALSQNVLTIQAGGSASTLPPAGEALQYVNPEGIRVIAVHDRDGMWGVIKVSPGGAVTHWNWDADLLMADMNGALECTVIPAAA